VREQVLVRLASSTGCDDSVNRTSIRVASVDSTGCSKPVDGTAGPGCTIPADATSVSASASSVMSANRWGGSRSRYRATIEATLPKGTAYKDDQPVPGRVAPEVHHEV